MNTDTKAFVLSKVHLELLQMIKKRGIGRVCNDLEPEEEALLTQSEWEELSKASHDWNGDPEEYDPKYAKYMSDFMVVEFLEYTLYKRLELLENFVQEMEQEIQKAYDWHVCTGMKVATTPRINLATAEHLLRMFSVLK